MKNLLNENAAAETATAETTAEVIRFPAAAPKRKRKPEQRGKRGRKAWPGVALSKSRAGVYYLRYRDPATQRVVCSSCKTPRRELAEEHARLKSAWLRRHTDRIALQRAAGQTAAPGSPLDGEFAAYYSELFNGTNVSPHTLRNVERPLERFRAWLAAKPDRAVHDIGELSVRLLADYYRHLRAARQRSGEPYKITWVNQQIKPLKTVLYRAISEDRSSLTEASVRRVLKHTRVDSRAAQRKHRVETSRPLNVDELQRFLRAAIAYDRAGHRFALASPDIALCTLYALRRAELVQLRRRDVIFGGDDPAVISVTAAIAKGSEPRLVWSTPWTELGVELLRALTDDRDNDEWLGQLTYHAVYEVFRTLRSKRYGVPNNISPHDLRATCATYQYYVTGVNPKLARKRTGHTEHNEDSSYIAEVRGARRNAASLEHAMDIEPELREIISLVREQRFKRRNKRRAIPHPKVRHSLLKPLRSE